MYLNNVCAMCIHAYILALTGIIHLLRDLFLSFSAIYLLTVGSTYLGTHFFAKSRDGWTDLFIIHFGYYLFDKLGNNYLLIGNVWCHLMLSANHHQFDNLTASNHLVNGF